jgi:hypothetical protein
MNQQTLVFLPKFKGFLMTHEIIDNNVTTDNNLLTDTDVGQIDPVSCNPNDHDIQDDDGEVA